MCDQRRVVANCAAALVWLDDDRGAAEEYARRAVIQYEDDDGWWIHHLATTRMNLALFLARSDCPAEAAHVGGLALESSWRLCRTDGFLAADLDRLLTSRFAGDAEVSSFHDLYLAAQHTIGFHRDDEPPVLSG